MNLPNGGKIVIIDDKYNEIEPLIRIMNDKNVAVQYYDGIDSLPKRPLIGTRIVFLDLTFSTSADEVVNASRARSVIDRIISKNNGPYLLVIWSSVAEETRDEIEFKFKDMINAPEKIVILSKVEYFDTVESEYSQALKVFKEVLWEEDEIDTSLAERIMTRAEVKLDDKDSSKKQFRDGAIQKLREDIFSGINSAGLLPFITEWENCVRDAVPEIMGGIYGMIPDGVEIQNKLPSVVEFLAKNNLGENNYDGASSEQKLNATIEELNEMFSFFYEKCTEKILDDAQFDISKSIPDILKNEKSRLNTWKMIRNQAQKDVPGGIYKDTIKRFKWDGLLLKKHLTDEVNYKKCLRSIHLKKKIEYILINITHECDLAQGKAAVLKFVPGVLVPVKTFDDLVEKKIIKASGYKECILELRHIIYEEKEYVFIVNCSQATYLEKKEVGKLEQLFSITRPYYLKVRQEVANGFLKQGENLYH